MSNPGEREIAPEAELETEIDEGLDTADTDEGGDDEGDGDSGEGDEHLPEGDDESKGTGERGAEHQVEGAAPKKGNPEFGRLRQRARDAEEAKVRAEARLAEIERERHGRQTADEKRLEAERIALMPPEEKTDYLLQQQERRFEARFGALQFQQADASDRIAFESLCARTPAMAAVRDEVDRQLGDLRRSGGNTTRETLAVYLIGKRAIDNAGRSKAKQQKRGEANIQRQTARPSNAGGSVPSGDRRSGGDERAQRAKRLDGVEI